MNDATFADRNGPVLDPLRNGERCPHRPAILYQNRSMNWSALRRRVSRLASYYLERGLQPGDRVASLMPNHPSLLVHYLACWEAGLVATPLNYRYSSNEIDHALEISGAALLLHHAERTDDVTSSRRCNELSSGVLTYHAETEFASRCWARPRQLPKPPDDAAAFLFFTSGSTGRPKGVTHSRQSWGWMLRGAINGLELTEDDIVMPVSSFSHIGGTLFGLASLVATAPLVVPQRIDGGEILGLMQRYGPTVVWMLPAPLMTLMHDQEVNAEDFATVRLCVSGGDKVALALEKEFSELMGFPIDESYGMTEVGLTTINPPSGENRAGSVGKALPGYELSIRDEAGVERPVGAPGRLWIRSPTAFTGYWNDPLATSQTIVDGWVDTGDIMRLDRDGYLWFCGRKKQIIVHDGSNICPQEVEEAVASHPAVDAVGVVGVHDLIHGENVRAFVKLKDGHPPTSRAELIQFARSLVGYKAPEEIHFMGELPLNAAGKIDRMALKQIAASELNLVARPNHARE